jgi:hypothetical protein
MGHADMLPDRHAAAAIAFATLLVTTAACARREPTHRFAVTVSSSTRSEPLTGRVYVAISHDSAPEPRYAVGSLGAYFRSAPFFGVDVDHLAPGQSAVITDGAPGYPMLSLRGLPAGDYYVQALANVYTEAHRADGHTIWVHFDNWEGQHASSSPGNLASEVQRIHYDPAQNFDLTLQLTKVLPALPEPPDTKWVKHVKFQSAMLTKFWGHPIFIGATVLLPQGYDEHPRVRYPVLYEQTHFLQHADNVPLGFRTDSGAPGSAGLRATNPVLLAQIKGYNYESGYDLYKEWNGPHFPRFVVVNFLGPTPYYDDSYVVNSANTGPWGDAITQEGIPYLESHFRLIPKGYARVLSGGSTGGWESLALQFYHPDEFGGAWSSAPDPVDFRHYGIVDAYADSNAFTVGEDVQLQSPVGEFLHPERPMSRGVEGQQFLTVRQESQIENALGTHNRSSEVFENWEAVYGPVGDDGYPKPLWDKTTGHIDHDVAAYMRDHGYDLRAYLAKNWAAVGPKLVDKVHVDVGDMDNYYLNLAVYDLQAFFDSSKGPHLTADFRYGRPEKGHGWYHTTAGGMLREMAASITKHAPPGENPASWKY